MEIVSNLPKTTGLVNHRAMIQIQAIQSFLTASSIHCLCFLRACLCNRYHEAGENRVLSSRCWEPFLFEGMCASLHVSCWFG